MQQSKVEFDNTNLDNLSSGNFSNFPPVDSGNHPSVVFDNLPAEFSGTAVPCTTSATTSILEVFAPTSCEPQHTSYDSAPMSPISAPSVALSAETSRTEVSEGSPHVAGQASSVPQLPLEPLQPKYRHVCTEAGCSESFGLRRQLENHMKKHKFHTGEICSASYSHRKSLREHRQSKHDNIRYNCDVPGCRETVAHRKNLARHKALRHRPQSNNSTLLPA